MSLAGTLVPSARCQPARLFLCELHGRRRSGGLFPETGGHLPEVTSPEHISPSEADEGVASSPCRRSKVSFVPLEARREGSHR